MERNADGLEAYGDVIAEIVAERGSLSVHPLRHSRY